MNTALKGLPIISINGKEVTADEVESLTFSLLNLSGSMKRCELQYQQAMKKPTDKEVMEFERAYSNVRRYCETHQLNVAKILKGKCGDSP